MVSLVSIIIAIFLILLNAFFVAAEFSMVKLRYTRVQTIKKHYGMRGKILARVHKNLDAYLSACQLGITLASIGLGWVGEPAFAHIFKPVFAWLGISSTATLDTVALFSAFTFISFLHIIIGEMMPKSMAIRAAEQVSLATALPLYGFYWLMYPAIWLMNTCTNQLLILTQLYKSYSGDYSYSSEEIKLILNSSFSHGELTRDEKKILEHTLDLADLNITDIMRPVEEMVVLHIPQSISHILEKMREHRYSRYPVYDDELKKYVGLIHVKDVFTKLISEKGNLAATQLVRQDMEAFLREILIVSRRLPALDLLRKFRAGMPHFALVYSGTKDNIIGFVTLDNLLHILLGRVKDEFHRTRDNWVREADGSIMMPGKASIYALERALNIDLEEVDNIDDDEVETITGLILHRLGHLPKVGDVIAFAQFDLLVHKMKGSRILYIRVIPKK